MKENLIKDIIKKPEDRVFLLDEGCIIIYTGETLEDFKPFVRIGNSDFITPPIIADIEKIIIPELPIGDISLEPLNVDLEKLSENIYISTPETIINFFTLTSYWGFPTEDINKEIINNKSSIKSSQKRYMAYFYKSGNIKIEYNKKIIFDLFKTTENQYSLYKFLEYLHSKLKPAKYNNIFLKTKEGNILIYNDSIFLDSYSPEILIKIYQFGYTYKHIYWIKSKNIFKPQGLGFILFKKNIHTDMKDEKFLKALNNLYKSNVKYEPLPKNIEEIFSNLTDIGIQDTIYIIKKTESLHSKSTIDDKFLKRYIKLSNEYLKKKDSTIKKEIEKISKQIKNGKTLIYTPKKQKLQSTDIIVEPTKLFYDPLKSTPQESYEEDIIKRIKKIKEDRERILKLIDILQPHKPSKTRKKIDTLSDLQNKYINMTKIILPPDVKKLNEKGILSPENKTTKDKDKKKALPVLSILSGSILIVVAIIAIITMLTTSKTPTSLTSKHSYKKHKTNSLHKQENKNTTTNIKKEIESKITPTDIYRFANKVATLNGYKPIDYKNFPGKDPNWIYPGNIFKFPDGTIKKVKKGDTLWKLCMEKLIENEIYAKQLIKRLHKNQEVSKKEIEKIKKLYLKNDTKKELFKTLRERGYI